MTADTILATSRTGHRRTPLADLGAYVTAVNERRLTLREMAFVPQCSIRIAPDRLAGTGLDGLLPVTPNTWIERDGVTALWFGPDEWLLVGEPLAQDALLGPLADAVGEHGALVEVSAQRVVLEVSGERVREVLSHGCSLDLHPRSWQPGAVAQTLLARSPAAIALRAADPDVAWLLVRVSYAPYVLAWLADAIGGLPSLDSTE